MQGIVQKSKKRNLIGVGRILIRNRNDQGFGTL